MIFITRDNVYVGSEYNHIFGLKKACKYGQIQVLELIISKERGYNIRSFEYGCQYGQINVIKFFLEKVYEEATNKSVLPYFFPLFYAGIYELIKINKNASEILDYFIEKKMDCVNYALLCAARENNVDIIKKMIKCGANNINEVLEEITTPETINLLKSFL